MSKKAALANGADEVIMWNDRWLRAQTDFYKQNKFILDQPRGGGYWLWKPYAILETLKKLNEDDILFYADSGAELINHIQPLVNIVAEKDIVLFKNHGLTNSAWTKRDCFYLMDCDTPLYYNGPQLAASYMLLKKTSKNIDLVKEWLDYCSNRHIITDDENICGQNNYPDFVEHRHDQSVLSLLAIKHNLELFRDPSQFGRGPDAQLQNSPYPTLFDLHRGKYVMFTNDIFRFYYENGDYTNLVKHVVKRAYDGIRSRKSKNN